MYVCMYKCICVCVYVCVLVKRTNLKQCGQACQWEVGNYLPKSINIRWQGNAVGGSWADGAQVRLQFAKLHRSSYLHSELAN